MNVTLTLLLITCSLMAYFFVKSIIPAVMKVFITPLIRIGSYSVTALRDIFSPISNASTTSSETPSFVFTSNPFAYFQLKLAGMHKSWTIWFNAFVAGIVPMLDYAQANLPAIQPYIPANYYGYLMLVAVVGNLVLRFKTYNSLAEKVTPNVQPPSA